MSTVWLSSLSVCPSHLFNASSRRRRLTSASALSVGSKSTAVRYGLTAGLATLGALAFSFSRTNPRRATNKGGW